MKIKSTSALALLVACASWQGLLAQQTQPPAKPAKAADEETIVLSPFEVTATKDNGYQATETMAGTRIRTDLRDVGSAISVITKEFLQDIGATDNGTLLQYTTNAEVAGTRGTYSGLGNGTTVDETGNLRAPGGAQRVRGLAAADNTRDFFVTDIPWDSFDVDRIDIQRGPNSILFGLGSPAGIVNATTRNAEFRDKGEVQFRTGSYGSTRSAIDVNQDLIHNVLAIRVDGLWKDTKYEQKPAFENDKRFYGAIRFEPQLFKDPSLHTSIKAKFENGDIKANRPRTTPPQDSITPWFRPVNYDNLNGGMGKLVIDTGYPFGANLNSQNSWLTAPANRQQPLWFTDGTSDTLYRIYGGYVNTGALNNNGTNRGAGGAIIGQNDSDEFYGLTSLDRYATNAKVPGYQYGQFRAQSLQDPSVFNFYKTLIDGPTASQFEKWNAYNVDLAQTALNDRIGVELSYDRQKYKRGGQNLLPNPAINIDIMQRFQDLSANPNFGRPYVIGGPGNGNSYESDRKYIRGSLFGELRTSDFLHNDFMVKLLGKHRFNGVYSKEDYATENRGWQMYAHSREWDALWNQTDGSSHPFTDRAPLTVIYLGGAINGQSTAAGANIPGITAPITIPSGNIYDMQSTWANKSYSNGLAIQPGDPWSGPSGSQTTVYTATVPTGGWTQASNPANYIGWNSNFQDNILSYNNGQNQSLTTSAAKALRTTKSYAGSWQGYLWNEAIIPTLGWRYDEVKSLSATALGVNANRQFLNLNETGVASTNPYTLPNFTSATINGNQGRSIFKAHSTAGGVVVHLNQLFGDKDPLPFNISVSYNKSSNFQVTDTRRDVFGTVLSNPTGTTKDYGLTLSTKDGKYSLRVVKYENTVINGSAPIDLSGLAGTITQGIKFRNVFLYRLNGYTWDTREQTDLTPGRRYFWTPAYINSAGRPTADLNGSPASGAVGTLETQAQADAHRDASIRAWNTIQTDLTAKGFFSAWNYTPTTLSALTDRATYEATLGPNTTTENGINIPVQNNAALQPAISTLQSYVAVRPTGLTVTADTVSKGYEFEFTANPTKDWRFEFNASQTNAVRSNVGGPVLDALVSYLDTAMAGVAGDMRQFNGNYASGNEVRQNWANWRGQYTLLKLQQGAAAPEVRKWRYNIVTNYSFSHGALKGTGVGGGYRWQDKVIIGYPVVPGTGNLASFDLSKPYFGPSEDAIDLWLSYERKLTSKVNWKIQLNVTNVGKKDGLIPISVEADGHTWAAVRVQPVQEWFVTNTFSF